MIWNVAVCSCVANFGVQNQEGKKIVKKRKWKVRIQGRNGKSIVRNGMQTQNWMTLSIRDKEVFISNFISFF